jgi:hypothetical protein
MANTTNFNWETPDDTDLVKDGAAAIRTLGSAIDTSLVDLKGGTTGQVLSKATNTDMDFTWVAQDDSNAIQNAIIDAKGDLIAGSAADTPAIIAVGANNTVLTADSSTATGLKWAAVPSSTPTYIGVSLRASADQTISNNTFTALTWNTENFDTDGFHDNSTNTSRITIPSGKGGKYLINAGIMFGTAGGARIVRLRINGTDKLFAEFAGNSTFFQPYTLNEVFSLVATDYIEFFVYQNSGGNVTAYKGTTDIYGWFSASLLGA